MTHRRCTKEDVKRIENARKQYRRGKILRSYASRCSEISLSLRERTMDSTPNERSPRLTTISIFPSLFICRCGEKRQQHLHSSRPICRVPCIICVSVRFFTIVYKQRGKVDTWISRDIAFAFHMANKLSNFEFHLSNIMTRYKYDLIICVQYPISYIQTISTALNMTMVWKRVRF